MPAESPRDRFLALLKSDILALDDADLDFGVYRILKRRRAAILAFLDQDLPARLDAVLGQAGAASLAALDADLDAQRQKVEAAARTVGYPEAFDADGALRPGVADLPVAQAYATAREARARAAAEGGFSRDEQADLFHHLYTFFARYYRDGDFQPQLRRSRSPRYTVAHADHVPHDDGVAGTGGVPVSPYNGQDVHLHWRSRGMHYAKTAEHLRLYRATDAPSGLALRFEIVEAETDRDNAKPNADRLFVPLPKQARVDDDGAFVVPFEHRALTAAETTRLGTRKKDAQDALLDEAADAPQRPAALAKDALRRHLARYVRKNSRDYFIHPRLDAFLRDELDHYLKAEYLDLDGATDANALAPRLAKLHALRQIGRDLIGMLDGVETFQARLFEKRRFVFQNDYLVPVRLVPETLWPEILQNAAQQAEWAAWFGLDDDATADTLRTHPSLVVHTRHFRDARTGSNPLRDAVLEAFDDVDEATDGLLVYGENYGALRTLGPRYAGQVKCIYIDPPYNTGGGDFLYKDDFARHSTWLTMMEERLRLARPLMADDGALFVSIDDNEYVRLKELLDGVMGEANHLGTVVWQKKYAPANDAINLSTTHDYVPAYGNVRGDDAGRRSVLRQLPRSEKQDRAYRNPDNDERGDWKPGDYTSNKSADERPGLYYSIVNPNTKEEVWPSRRRVWAYDQDRHERNVIEGRVWWGADGTARVPAYKRFLSDMEGTKPATLWTWEEAGHNQDGVRALQDLFGESPFRSPKPPSLVERVLRVAQVGSVLDFFAGSGTTGHAVVNLNREDGGQRRFVLTEMGEHFHTVLVPRIAKVMVAPAWKAGRPAESPAVAQGTLFDALPEWMKRGPRLVQILALESYDDSLDALAAPEADADLFDADRLAYLLPDAVGEAGRADVLLNLERLERPFGYALRVHTAEGERMQPVDLVATANLALGLRVRRQRRATAKNGTPYVLVEADDAEGRRMLVVWRTLGPDFDPAQDADVLRTAGLEAASFDRVLVNADAALPKAESLDPLLLAALIARDPLA